MPIGAALVGRDVELARVVAVLEAAGDAPLLAVVGEAGIGKTRLTATSVERARAGGRLVLRGWCLDLSERLPFLPFVDVLRELAAHHDARLLKEALTACPVYVEHELVALLPERAREPVVPGEVAGWRRERVFGAVQALLSAVGELTPLAVVIEDLHWADPSTRDLVRYLAAPAHRSGVPFVFTARNDAGGAGWLDAVGGVDRLPLGPLDSWATAVIAEGRSPDEIEEIHHRSGGNPLFIEHLLASDSAALPSSLDALLLRRVDAVDALSREVVRCLAVVNRPADDEMLTALLDAADIGDAVRTLVSSGLVDRVAARTYQLHHALLAEAVRGQMTTDETRGVHARAAEVLGARDDVSIAGDVAEHYAATGDRAAEARWRLRAAQYADAVVAPVEASRQWRRLIELSRDGRLPECISLADLYLRTVSALERANDGNTASELAGEALDRIGPISDADDQVRVYSLLGRSRTIVYSDEGRALLQRAVDAGEGLPAGRHYVRALLALAQSYYADLQRVSVLQEALLSRALAASRRAGLHAEEKAVTAALAWCASATGDHARSRRLLATASVMPVKPPDPELETMAAVYMTDIALKVNDLDGAIRHGQAALEAAHRAGYPRTFEVAILHSNLVEALREQGRTTASGQVAEVVIGEPIARSTVIGYTDLAALRLAQGDLRAAGRIWTDVENLLTDWPGHFDREFQLLRAEFHLWSGHADTVVRNVLPALAELAETGESSLAGSLFLQALRACGDRAEAARATSDTSALAVALVDAETLAELVERCVNDPFTPDGFPADARANGAGWRAEWTRLRGASAAGAWASAAAAWKALGRPHREAYALWRQAEAMLAAPAARGAAAPVLRAAFQVAHEHVPLTDAISALARRARVELVSAGPPPSPPTADVRPFGLTERELAVLELISQGLTNNDIAARLFVSPKTASVHVSNILRKMQVTSRVQAATIAARLGLAGPLT